MSKDFLSEKLGSERDLTDRIAGLSETKRALLELRLARSHSKANAVQGFEPTSPSWSFLVPLQSIGSKPPFFWVHGENSNVFLPRYLGPDQPLYAILHQSRDGKKARHTRVEEMAFEYLKEIRSVQPNGPYFLGGFCIGATVTFEMARYLRTEGEEIALLLLVDPVTPGAKTRKSLDGSSRPKDSIPNNNSYGNRVFCYFHRLVRLGTKAKLSSIRDTVTEKSSALVTRITEELAKLQRTTTRFGYGLVGKIYYFSGIEPVPPSVVNFYLDAVYWRAGRSYKPQVYPGKVVILTTIGNLFDPRKGFSGLAGEGLEVVDIDAKHGEVMYDEPQFAIVAAKLKAYLHEAHASLPSKRT